jgi:hypothetical protein
MKLKTLMNPYVLEVLERIYMENEIIKLFEDKPLVEKIQKKLPYLFQLAELESSRAGRVGMEVGSAREKIITALLIYKFGEKNPSDIKLIWTVDAQKSIEFSNSYYPKLGASPRGIEMTGTAMRLLINNLNTMRIFINWRKKLIDFKPFARRVELWQMD